MTEHVSHALVACLLLRLVHQHWAQAVDAALSRSRLRRHSPAARQRLHLRPAQGIQVSALTQLARVRKQTMAQAVEELERLGYVERRADPSDGRARLVFLTPRGEAVRPVAIAAGRRVEARWAELVGPRRSSPFGTPCGAARPAAGRYDAVKADQT